MERSGFYEKMVVVSLLTLSMAVGSFSCVSAAALDHTSEIAVQSATDSATNNTDALQTEDQTANTDEKVNEMMKSIENTLASVRMISAVIQLQITV